ncbi:MAG: WGR domain-containing protein [Candidatus Competibacteraceae bacterium]|jgi:predicted DNA-binding WGR domain protein|nr:WGR domain-containing protein [Candidatus Competibacteraceae bacterium]
MGSEETIKADPPVWISQRWERDTRYYQVYLQQDLWGNWVVTRVWGRQGSRLGRVVNQPCANYAEAQKVLEQIGRRREQHGYERCI